MKAVVAMRSLLVAVVLVVVAGVVMGCASGGRCDTDSCYRDEVAKVDPFEAGETAQWGSEKESYQQDKQKHDSSRDPGSEHSQEE